MPQDDVQDRYRCCKGITFYTAAMRSDGREPLCWGRRQDIEKVDIPAEKDSLINEESDFTFASIGSSVYTEKMLSSGHLPYVARGITGTMIQAAEGKAIEGRRSFRSPDGSRRARGFQGAEGIPRQTGGGAVEKRPPEEQSRTEHVDQDGELHHTGLLEQVLTKSMESATHIARNFPQKFREHAGAHLEKAKEMPRMMSAFAAKNVNMLEKIIATVSKTGKNDGDE